MYRFVFAKKVGRIDKPNIIRSEVHLLRESAFLIGCAPLSVRDFGRDKSLQGSRGEVE